MFIAGAQHVVQPTGHGLTFSKCLCRLLYLSAFLDETWRGGGGGGGNLSKPPHVCSSYAGNWRNLRLLSQTLTKKN